MKKITFLRMMLVAVVMLLGSSLIAQVNISAGATVMQDFSIGTSATATLPTGWKVDKNTTVRSVGSYASAVTATERIGENSLSSTAANGIYNFGAGPETAATDRAIGGLSSGSASKSVNLYVQLTNNGASEITDFTISYNVEKYRKGSNAAGFSIQMYYSTNGTTWTSAGSDFLTSFAADADNNGYTTAPGATVSVTAKTLAQTLAASSSLYLAWNYSVTTGTTTSNAQALGVDDISITANGGSSNPTVATPTFSPEAGTYYSDQNVTISTETAGATIRYTTNGNDPDETSTIFSTPIAVSASTTIKAKAFKTDMDPSEVASATYTIIKTPTITVEESSIPAMSAYVDASDSETITVNGVNLTTDITLSLGGADAAQFRLSTSTLAQTDGSVTDASVTIYYEPKAAGSHTATLTLSSNGATDVTRTLNGEVIEPITTPNVIITEVYGGGGNTGATIKQDYIELYNTTENSIEIGGWSVQYYSATGTGLATNVYVIPNGKYIPPQKHFLIQAAAGTGGTVDLDKPDAISELALSGTNGKVILYMVSEAQTISDIASITGNEHFKDYVPYGSTATPVWGSALPSTTNTTSASRKKVSNVYVYTQNIGDDFEVVTPNPENSGLSTATNQTLLTSNIYAHNANIHFAATAGEKVEVYNAVGQKIISTLATDGQNELPVNAKGVMIVKVGSRLAKVIL